MRAALISLIVSAVLVGACGSDRLAPATSSGASSPKPPTTEASSDEATETPHTKAAPRISADAAPNFTVTTFDGDSFVLYEELGKPVVINFFDSW